MSTASPSAPFDTCDIESNFRAILETISDCVIVIDDRGHIQLVNPAVERLFGYRREELIGQNVSMLMPSPDQMAHDGYLEHYRTTGEKKVIGGGREVQGRNREGRTFPVYLSVGELQDGGQRRFVGILHDLTNRKQSEERVALLSRAVEQSPAGIVIMDLESRIEFVNKAFSQLTGYESHRLLGQCLRQLGETMPSIANNAQLWASLASVKEWAGEIQDWKYTGQMYWALANFSPIRDAKGRATKLMGRFQDITQQKRDQNALAESENRFRVVARMVGEWLWEQDQFGRYTYSSAAVEDILGYRPEEIVGKYYMDLMTDEARTHWTDNFAANVALNGPFHKLVNQYRHRDGHEVFTESTGSPILDENGRILKWRGMDLDITDRKRSEDAVRLRERAIEAASVGIAIADARQPGLPNIYVNAALCQITGYSEQELVGRSLRMLQGKDTDYLVINELRSALEQGRHCEVIIRNYRKDGAGFWNELLLSPVRDTKGDLTHWIGIVADVSERRKSEEAKQELEIARHIQLSLLPKTPLRLGSVELAGVCIPASQVGGDYYDFFCHGDHVDLVIADVSGHSVGAALIMAEMRSALKAEIRRDQARPASCSDILTTLNEVLFTDLDGADLFITMFYMRINRKTRQLNYASAGHNRPLLQRKGAAECEWLDADGLIFGVNPEIEFEEKTLQLQEGDRLLLYTDGVTETRNLQGEFFGENSLIEALRSHPSLTPDATLEFLISGLHDYRGTAPLHDDITMVSVRIL